MNLSDLFSVGSLTDAINKLPAIPTRVASSGLFAEKGIKTTVAMIDVKGGRLVLVPDQSRTGDGINIGNPKRSGVPVNCAHLPATGWFCRTKSRTCANLARRPRMPACVRRHR